MSLATTLDLHGHPQALARLPIARRSGARALLLALTVAAFAAALLWQPSVATRVDDDLARLLRFMALLKGAFALVGFAAAWWRLARPAAPWRTIVYLAGPGLMAAGAVALGRLTAPGLATIGLHAGMFALLAAGLTDESFIPARWRRAGSRPAGVITPRG